jgi:hypothetical protein
MRSDTVVDRYTLTFERVGAVELQHIRAIATNTATELTAEAQLNLERVRLLFERMYDGNEEIIETQLSHVMAGAPFDLVSQINTKGNSKCIFSFAELAELGFDPRELQENQQLRADATRK